VPSRWMRLLASSRVDAAVIQSGLPSVSLLKMSNVASIACLQSTKSSPQNCCTIYLCTWVASETTKVKLLSPMTRV